MRTRAFNVFRVGEGGTHVKRVGGDGNFVMSEAGGGRVDGRRDEEDGQMRRDGAAQARREFGDLEGGFQRRVSILARGCKEMQF